MARLDYSNQMWDWKVYKTNPCKWVFRKTTTVYKGECFFVET